MVLKFSLSAFQAPSLISAIAILFSTATTVRAENHHLKKQLVETTKNCPTDPKILTERLLEDLPDYGNRVLKRTQDDHYAAGIDTYIIVAGQPEFEPLNLPQIKYHPTKPKDVEQIFFTTLERQYQNKQKIEREAYHWLFVTMADDGWYLVTMFSRFGDAAKNTPPAPPIESSKGIVGQAISLWLRDCRQSAIFSSL